MQTENYGLFYQLMLEFDWSRLHSLDYSEVTEAYHELSYLHSAAEALPGCKPIFNEFVRDALESHC